MLHNLLFSLMWAVLSSCLIRPWFWLGIIRRDLYSHSSKEIGFEEDNAVHNIQIELIIALTIFSISMLFYSTLGLSDMSISFLMSSLCAIAQTVWQHQKISKYAFFICISLCCIFIPFNNLISANNCKILLKERFNEKSIFSDEVKTILTLGDLSSINYHNQKIILSNRRYIVPIRRNNRATIAIIDKNGAISYTEYKLGFDIENIRMKYRNYHIEKLFITADTLGIPYGVFAVTEQNSFLGDFSFKYYILLNLQNGDINEYTENQLPNYTQPM